MFRGPSHFLTSGMFEFAIQRSKQSPFGNDKTKKAKAKAGFLRKLQEKGVDETICVTSVLAMKKLEPDRIL